MVSCYRSIEAKLQQQLSTTNKYTQKQEHQQSSSQGREELI